MKYLAWSIISLNLFNMGSNLFQYSHEHRFFFLLNAFGSLVFALSLFMQLRIAQQAAALREIMDRSLDRQKELVEALCRSHTESSQ